VLEILSRLKIGKICPRRSQNIEASLLQPPYRTFLNGSGSHGDNLLLYCVPASVCEYIGFHEETATVRSQLLKNKCVVGVYDAQSDKILGGSVDDVLNAFNGDRDAASSLAAAALNALGGLDREVAVQLQNKKMSEHNGNTVVVVGSGGREHALAVALAKSPLVDSVVCCPGNGGTELEGGKISNCGSDENNATVIQLVRETSANMVVVGPEMPLVNGLIDELATECPSVRAFGPSKAAAELEASKVRTRNRNV
jgi:hypothetical protein